MEQTWHSWGGVVAVSVLLLVPVAALICVGLARRRRRAGVPSGWAWRSSVAEVGIVAGTAPWIWMILTPRGAGRTLWLVPFHEVTTQLSGGAATAVQQIGGNLLVFAAFGALAPVRWRIGPPTVVAAAAFGSLTVETLQYVLNIGRFSSVDDVLVNAAGAGLAALTTARWWRRRAAVQVGGYRT